MPIRHTWTLLLLLVVALAPASAKQEQLCHELLSALQSDATVADFTGTADEESTSRFLSGLLCRNAGKFFTALGDGSTSVNDLRLGDRIDWIEAEAGESIWNGEPQMAMRDSVAQAVWHAPLAEVEWCRQFLAEP
jgi:hypothetical protein